MLKKFLTKWALFPLLLNHSSLRVLVTLLSLLPLPTMATMAKLLKVLTFLLVSNICLATPETKIEVKISLGVCFHGIQIYTMHITPILNYHFSRMWSTWGLHLRIMHQIFYKHHICKYCHPLFQGIVFLSQ
jgi:hypothetical protein